jgi:hypothetical protein
METSSRLTAFTNLQGLGTIVSRIIQIHSHQIDDVLIHNAEKPDRGICTAAMQHDKGSDLQQVQGLPRRGKERI